MGYMADRAAVPNCSEVIDIKIRYCGASVEVLVWVGPAHYEVGQFANLEQVSEHCVLGGWGLVNSRFRRSAHLRCETDGFSIL